MKLGVLALAWAVSCVLVAGLAGGAITSLIWIAETPAGAARALHWGMLHGLLIGAPGIALGPISGLVTAARNPRSPSATAAAGAILGVPFGAGLGLMVWTEPAGEPVAFASVVALAGAGAAVALVARRFTARTWRPSARLSRREGAGRPSERRPTARP